MAIDLHGASPALEPYARKASEFGLVVTSGKDDHSTNSVSGHRSHHADGNAIDVSGPKEGMAKFFEWARSTLGGQLEELIYTPGGAEQIKNGKPYLYGGDVAAGHDDHVHIADTDPSDGDADGDGRGFLGNAEVGFNAFLGGGKTVLGKTTSVVGSPISSFVDSIAESGGRLLLEIALILGGAVLALWGVVRLSGAQPSDIASIVPAARLKGAVK